MTTKRTGKKRRKQLDPDFAALERLGAEMESLQMRGLWTKEHFDRLLAEAKRAVNGDDEYLEFLINEAEPGWLDDA